jgi:hypothetical protein
VVVVTRSPPREDLVTLADGDRRARQRLAGAGTILRPYLPIHEYGQVWADRLSGSATKGFESRGEFVGLLGSDTGPHFAGAFCSGEQ